MSEQDTDARFDLLDQLRNLDTPPGANCSIVTKDQQGLSLEWRADASWLEPVKFVATSDQDTGGGVPDDVDGFGPSAGDRILLTAQTEPTANGIWIITDGEWTRAPDCKGTEVQSLNGRAVSVKSGEMYANSIWILTGKVGAAIQARAVFVSTAMDAGATQLYDPTTGNVSIDWGARTLHSYGGDPAIDWNNRELKSADGETSVDWQGRRLRDATSALSIHYNNRTLSDSDGVIVVDYNGCTLRTKSDGESINWNTRQAYNTADEFVFGWAGISIPIPTIATATDLASAIAAVNAIRDRLEEFGMVQS